MPTLEWIGKDKVRTHHQDVPYRVLEHQYGFRSDNSEDKSETHSGNMVIHGDNLEALKALMPRYEGKIKCIYIDPPYNTGNEKWVYNDNVNHPKIKKWLGEIVGQQGEDLSRHDKWLCMMYPRLVLLHKLLAETGAIFISIDDNEYSNLKFICDEIFGVRNNLATLIWKTDGNYDNQAKIKVCHEYILVYGKDASVLGLPKGIDPSIPLDSKIFKDEIRNTVVKNGSKNPMSKIKLPIGFPCAVKNLKISERYDAFPYYHSDAIIENYRLTNEVVVESGWASKNILNSFIAAGFQSVMDTKNQKTRFEITATGAIEMVKERDNDSYVISLLSGLGSTQNMSSLLKKMGLDFDFPKPTSLLEYLINFYAKKDSIVLDSFAGSGTTAHSVLNLNKDGGNRKFILIEMEDYADTVTAERVKRVISGYGEGKKAIKGTGGEFDYYELGDRLFDDENMLNEKIEESKIREYIYYTETRQPLTRERRPDSKYLLDTTLDTGYYFYYERDQITTLNFDTLNIVIEKADNYVIYADVCTLPEKYMTDHNITFKKIPRDIKHF